MAIVTGELLVKLSVSAAAGNTTAQGDPNASLGDQISTTAITDNSLHNLFDVVTGDENAASDVEYRCLFVHNSNASLAWQAPIMWLSAEVSGGAVAAVGWDTTAVSAVGSASAQALTVANESTAPAGVSFSAPTAKGSGIALGVDIPAGSVKAFWVRRTAANTVALDNDGVTIRIEGDTAA
jgi:hypothetical protein